MIDSIVFNFGDLFTVISKLEVSTHTLWQDFILYF